jgi:phosphonopyruvate decarboxylase
MIDTRVFGQNLIQRGYQFYSGVPCSFLKSLINYTIDHCQYLGAANEGEAVAIASGASVGGKKAVVLMQNSGLTNAVSPLTSLNYPFQIPLLGFVSLRGEPGLKDELQHELMGKVTIRFLSLMQIKWDFLSSETEEAIEQLQQADQCIKQNQPFFFVVRKGTIAPYELQTKCRKTRDHERPSRFEALQTIYACKQENDLLIATTGKTGRELYSLADDRNHLYMVGSMGCVSTFSMGLAFSQPHLNVVAIDGDGSLLMRMGSLATIGSYASANLLHILLDNQSYDSTGGQETVSDHVDFVRIAAACGYRHAVHVNNLAELAAAIRQWQQKKELTFLHLHIRAGSQPNLPRPHIKPVEVKERLQAFLAERKRQNEES